VARVMTPGSGKKVSSNRKAKQKLTFIWVSWVILNKRRLYKIKLPEGGKRQTFYTMPFLFPGTKCELANLNCETSVLLHCTCILSSWTCSAPISAVRGVKLRNHLWQIWTTELIKERHVMKMSKRWLALTGYMPIKGT
jgi:hypothetical protein